MRRIIWCLMALMLSVQICAAQTLNVSTVTRSPFSMVEQGQDIGFSIDLIDAISKQIGREIALKRHDSFGDMLGSVVDSSSDMAIANISITAERERLFDFSQPIFASGLQIMVPKPDGTGSQILRALASWDLFFAILLAFAVLLGMGMIMWRLERKAQPYFDHDARGALFPSFWWALNLVVNGGFEERMPRTPLGRVFGVLLVISSLFVVSVFVARITAVMTVDAIEGNVNSLNDLRSQNVATIDGSTAETFLRDNDLIPTVYADIDTLLDAFESEEVDAVIFDAPILAYYVNTNGRSIGEIVGPVLQRENYGIAFPPGSPLREPIDQALLRLRETGRYDALYNRWFGAPR